MSIIKELNRREDQHNFPSKFAITGPRGSELSLRMTRFSDNCGHKHDLGSTHKLGTGYFSDFTQKSQNWSPGDSLTQSDGKVDYRNIDYVTYGLCGDMKVLVQFKDSQGNSLLLMSFYLCVRYNGLKELTEQEGDNILLVGQTTSHPDNHYGTQKLIDAIKAVAKAYGEAYDEGKFDINGVKPHVHNKKYGKKLHVNDMSLVKGGRFDWKATLKPPHQEHMFGEEVDISIGASNMTTKQFKWLNSNGKKYGFKRFEPHPKLNPDHFHCSIVPRN